MFKRKTTFVLGAGSNIEIGMPSGVELKTKIASLTELHDDEGSTKISAPNEFVDTLVTKFGGHTAGEALDVISKAMTLSLSIDNFLEAHASNEAITYIGKLAIIECILQAERDSLVNAGLGSLDNLDFSTLEKSWFNQFFGLLTENCSAQRVPESLANLAVVTFNYDRCFEHYLIAALRQYYRISLEEAVMLLEPVPILHAYGQVGALPHLPLQNLERVELGGQLNPKEYLTVIQGVKTFTEEANRSVIAHIRESVRSSELLIFLGFAFHEQNMRLLAPEEQCSKSTDVFGTAVGMSNSDVRVITSEVNSMFKFGDDRSGEVVFRQDLVCAELLMEYRRSLTRERFVV